MVVVVETPSAPASAATSALNVDASAGVIFPDEAPFPIDASRFPSALEVFELFSESEASRTWLSAWRIEFPVTWSIEPAATPA